MKKSKLLQSSKDLLHRSFSPAKCKTSLKLAGSRLKLLRNKKEVQVKQMRREIAQLLESGQDQTARIRVEHVIREEKMMAAYDLIEIYCELIVARLSIIESQKNCPIDLKEAITSLIFASPRCGDIPELLDVRKQLTAKYGKEFSTAAIELRPACGVSRMLVEKLSAAAPDLQTKIKILTAIADEHNVKWDTGSVNEEVSVPPSDLLNVPSTFGRESNAHVVPFHLESPYVQAPSSNNKMHSSPLNFPHQDPRTSLGTENVVPAQASGASTTSQCKERLMGDERSQLFQGSSWNMEFKDAASAAQAAAESAERASMAARAAAELSNRDKIMRQYSSESNKLADDYVLKEEGSESYENSKPISKEHVEKLPSQYTKLQNEQIHGTEKDDSKIPANFSEDGRGDRKEYSQSDSSKLEASTNKEFLDHGVHVADGYSMKNSLKENSRVEMHMKKESFKNEAESANVLLEKPENIREKRKGKKPNVSDDVNIFSNPEMHMEEQSFKYGDDDVNEWPEKSKSAMDERVAEQHSVKSFHSHSSVSDEVNIFSNFKDQEVGYAVDENPFISIDKGDVHGEASHESASALFDKYDSDSDYNGFDIGSKYDEQDSQFHLPLTSQKSINSDSWPPVGSSKTVDSPSSLFFTRKNSSPEFSKNLTSKNDIEVDNFAPVTFDDSDGPTSDDEEANDMMSKRNKFGSSFKEKVYSEFNKEHFLSSDDELKTDEIHTDRKQGKILDSDKLRFEKSSIDQPPLVLEKPLMEPNDFSKESEFVSGKPEGLNFGKLTGGFRHKGNISPSYIKNPSLLKESTSIIKSPKKSNTLYRKESNTTPALHSDSDSDSSDEEVYSAKESDCKQKPYALHAGSEVKPKLNLGVLNFVSSNSDSGDDAPKESPSTKKHHQSGISRRTKTVASNSGTSSYSKMPVRSEALDSDAGMDREPTESYISKIPKESDPQSRKSSQQVTHEQPTSSKVASKPAKLNFWGPPETFTTLQDSKMHDSDASGERKLKNSYSLETQQEFQSSSRKSSQLGSSKPSNSSIFGAPEPINSGKADFTTVKESKIYGKSSVAGKSSTSASKMEASVSNESSKAATNNKTFPSKDDSNKKASHVHPKLPDYDSLVQSLRRS